MNEGQVILGYLTVIPASKTSGAIGSVSRSTHRMLVERLCDYLKLSESAAWWHQELEGHGFEDLHGGARS